MLQLLAFEAEQSGRVHSARPVHKTRRAAHAAAAGVSAAAAAVGELLAEAPMAVELLLSGSAVTSASLQAAARVAANVASAAETTVVALLQTAGAESLVDLLAQEDKWTTRLVA